MILVSHFGSQDLSSRTSKVLFTSPEYGELTISYCDNLMSVVLVVSIQETTVLFQFS